MSRDDYTDACELLTPSEIALILRQDPLWMLPRGRRRGDRRMEEARRLMRHGGHGEAIEIDERRDDRPGLPRERDAAAGPALDESAGVDAVAILEDDNGGGRAGANEVPVMRHVEPKVVEVVDALFVGHVDDLPRPAELLTQAASGLRAGGHTSDDVLFAAMNEVASAVAVLAAVAESRRLLGLVLSGRPLTIGTDGRIRLVKE